MSSLRFGHHLAQIPDLLTAALIRACVGPQALGEQCLQTKTAAWAELGLGI